MAPTSQCKPTWPRWAGTAVTVIIALIAYAVQWGVVTTKLSQIECRLGDIVTEVRTMRDQLAATERRVSFLEGRLDLKGVTP